MPRLQKLIDQFKNYSDVQFISLSIDDNPGLIQPFLKEHQLSLVVIPAHDYATDKLNVHGIPQSWIVDGNGVVRLKGFGYDTTEKWASSIKEAIERVKPGATASSASARSQP